MSEEEALVPIKEVDKNKIKKLDKDKTFKFECTVEEKLRLGLREIDYYSPYYFENFYSKQELEEINPIFRACSTLDEIQGHFFNLFKENATKLQLAENKANIVISFTVGWISGTKEIKFELIRKTVENKDNALETLYEVQKDNYRILEEIKAACNDDKKDNIAKKIFELIEKSRIDLISEFNKNL
jgi:hypothetical protein